MTTTFRRLCALPARGNHCEQHGRHQDRGLRMRADRDRAHTDQSQLELHVSDGPGAAGSITDCQRVLPQERLPADDLDRGGQRRRNQDRDVPVQPSMNRNGSQGVLSAGLRGTLKDGDQ